jgi:hypothetical protein
LKWYDRREVNLLTSNHALRLELRTTVKNWEACKLVAIFEYDNYMRAGV